MRNRLSASKAGVIIAALAVASALIIIPKREAPAAPESASAATSLRFKRVRLNTGVELQVAEAGPSDGKPVLFLHGFTDSWLSFSRVWRDLPPDVRAIIPSQRGHGDSERPNCCYRIADLAADGVALLDALGIDEATVVGHSMGSFVAQRIAIDYPDRVRRLVLIGSGTTIRTKAVVEFNSVLQSLKDPVDSLLAREFQVSTVYKPLPPAFLDSVVAESMKLPARVWRDVLAGLLAGDAKDELQRITARTLVMWGERDAYWDRAEQDALVRLIPGARLIAYPDIAHAPHWEAPARFVKDLTAFLREPNALGQDARRSEPGTGHADHEHTSSAGRATLLPGLGDWRLTTSTSIPSAQQFFDQGLRLTYAFDHDEAARSFEEAARLDSTCAMCWWGVAYALGPNINLPMSPEAEQRALAAIREAKRLARTASAREREYIDAMARRFGEPAGTDRPTRDSAYANAMRALAKRYPSDADAQVLFADAMLNLRPWNQWTRDGKPQPGTLEVVSVLEGVIARAPNHAGACHFYVHAVEASQTPERAIRCAERLPRLMPGAGHVVHMPAHVYLRVGRYADAARANISAMAVDRDYLAGLRREEGMYPQFYAPHNAHFLWACYLLSGQQNAALNVARALEQSVSPDAARSMASLEAFLTTVMLTHARFQAWDSVLAQPAPPPELRYVRGISHYARGLAYAARGNYRRGAAELDSLRAIASATPGSVIILLNPAPVLLELAADVLAGELALRQGRSEEALRYLRRAVVGEDALTYDEPPAWYHSARHRLGIALLSLGRPREAEAMFREDLAVYRETGWSLAGLERALLQQGRHKEAAAIASRLAVAWRDADVPAIERR